MGRPAELCPPGGRRIPAQVWDAAERARSLLAEAGVEAKALLERASTQADHIRADAAARGREEGLAAVAEQLERAAIERDRLLASQEPELVDLAFGIAARVLERAVEHDRDAVLAIAERALETARNRVDVTLRVHPDDAAVVRNAEPRLLERLTRARRIAVVEDGRVQRGGAIVETECIAVDARLETQLDALRRVLDEAARR